MNKGLNENVIRLNSLKQKPRITLGFFKSKEKKLKSVIRIYDVQSSQLFTTECGWMCDVRLFVQLLIYYRKIGPPEPIYSSKRPKKRFTLSYKRFSPLKRDEPFFYSLLLVTNYGLLVTNYSSNIEAAPKICEYVNNLKCITI